MATMAGRIHCVRAEMLVNALDIETLLKDTVGEQQLVEMVYRDAGAPALAWVSIHDLALAIFPEEEE